MRNTFFLSEGGCLREREKKTRRANKFSGVMMAMFSSVRIQSEDSRSRGIVSQSSSSSSTPPPFFFLFRCSVPS